MIVFNYSAPTTEVHDVEALLLANPASWIDADYLRRQAESPELSPAEVLQYHGNVWAAGTNAWLPEGAWDELADQWRGVPDGAEVVLGFDGSYSRDATALVGCTCDPTPHVFVVQLWERPRGARNWVVPRDEVDATVRRAMERWTVRELACDPPGWHAEIGQWTETYGSPPVIHVRTQETKLMAELSSRFYTAVVNRELTHDGDPRLAAHVANAVVKERPEGAVITKEGRHSSKKIDAAVAAVLAFGRAAVAEPMGGLVY